MAGSAETCRRAGPADSHWAVAAPKPLTRPLLRLQVRVRGGADVLGEGERLLPLHLHPVAVHRVRPVDDHRRHDLPRAGQRGELRRMQWRPCAPPPPPPGSPLRSPPVLRCTQRSTSRRTAAAGRRTATRPRTSRRTSSRPRRRGSRASASTCRAPASRCSCWACCCSASRASRRSSTRSTTRCNSCAPIARSCCRGTL